MKKIIHFSLNNKLALWLFTIIIVFSGLYSGIKMKMETMPDVNIPVLTVVTLFPGATPDQVNESLTTPIEQIVKNLDGVEAVSSNSMANASSIILEYNFDKDLSEAVAEVKEAVDKVSVPEGAMKPNVSKISMNSFPIYTASVSGEGKSLEELTKIAEDHIIPELQGIAGVASVSMAGQQIKEVELSFNEKALATYGLDQNTVQNIMKASDISASLGLYTFKDEVVSLIVDGNVTSIEDVENIKLPNAKKPNLRLIDVAELNVVTKADSISRTNGKETISFSVVKAQEANTVEVVKLLNEKTSKLEKTYDGIVFTTIFDQGKPIEDSVNTMLEKAFIGAIFAVIIILIFLRDMKTTLISIVSIPLSLLIAILLLKQMDITLNIMTLGAMTVAIGRVIDDSIVVIENIYRRMSLKEEKLKGQTLIIEATKEMFIPILSSTIVTIAVFLPLGLVKGTIGEIFMPFALTMVFSLLASLLVAITIVPMMAHSMFKNGVKHQTEHNKPGKLSRTYKKILNWSLNHKVITSSLAIVLLISSFGLVPLIGFSFMPSDQEKMIVVTYSPKAGQTKDSVEKVALEAEKYFMDKKDVNMVKFSIGGDGGMEMMNPGAANDATFYVGYDDKTENFDKETTLVMEDLSKLSSEGTWNSQGMSASASSNALTLFVYGEDQDEVAPIVEKVMNLLKKNDSFENIESSLTESYKEYTLVADGDKLSKAGLTAGQVAMSLNQFSSRPVLTTIVKDGEELNVYVKVEKTTYNSINDLTNKTISSPFGLEIPISEVVKVEKGNAINSVTKRNGQFYAQITADFKTKDIGTASRDLQNDIDNLKLPSTASVEFGGVTEQMTEAFTQLGLAILAAVAIVYLVLVITFGGGLAPFAILFSLPFTIIGGLVALFIAGETISVTSLIGVLMLIGIVVTNAIVLIHRVIHMEQDGMSTREAILEAGVTRLRPILMTAIATIGALIPLAIGVGGGGLISKGLGVTVIGGLISSTLLTLVIVPIVYETLMKIKNRKKRKAE